LVGNLPIGDSAFLPCYAHPLFHDKILAEF
jgi:hypothetical protein